MATCVYIKVRYQGGSIPGRPLTGSSNTRPLLNPPVQLPLLVPVLAAVILAVGWLSWRVTVALPLPRRLLYLSLRVLGAGALAALLLNPGKWVRPSSETPSPWLVLLDRSASFTPDAPGAWKISVTDPRENPPPSPEATFTVPAPVSENDNLSADPDFLQALADSTGGTLIPPGRIRGVPGKNLHPRPPPPPAPPEPSGKPHGCNGRWRC